MNRVTRKEQHLTHLLNNPAPLADRGFSDSLKARLQREGRRRRLVFAGVAVSWLVLALVVNPLETLFAWYRGLVQLGARAGEVATSNLVLDLLTSFMNGGNSVFVVVGVLAVLALLRSQLRW